MRSSRTASRLGTALALVTLLGTASRVLAANVYVDGAGGCNALAPCLTTIQDGVSHATAGDQVVVFPGTYAENATLDSMGSAVAGAPGNVSLVTANASGAPMPGTVTVNATGAGAAAFFASGFPGSITIDGFTVHAAQSDGIRLVAIDGSVVLADVDAEGSGDGASPDGTGDDGVQISTTGTGRAVTLTNCIANGNGGRGVSIETLPATALTVTITNVTASRNGAAGIEVGSGGGGVIDTLTVADVVAHGNAGLGLRLRDLAAGGTHAVHGSIVCGNIQGGLALLTPSATLDATGNLWGSFAGPMYPGGTGDGDTVFDAANGGQGTVGFTPFIDSVVGRFTPDPLVTGQPATVSFQYSGGSGTVFLGPGPGSANGTPPFTLSTDNGTLTSSTGSGASVTERIVGATGTVSVTLVTATDGNVTVTTDTPCNVAPGGPEICDNCVDDNADGKTDRQDPMCTPPADGGFAGTGNPLTGKAAVKCQQAIEKASVAFVAKKLARLNQCVTLAFACVQQKNGDASCLAKAKPKCDKQLAGVATDEAGMRAAIAKTCEAGGGKGIVLGDALAATGLGFSGEEVPCHATFSSLSDVLDCVVARHECGAERMLVAAAPRAMEMLRALGHEPATDLSCLAAAGAVHGVDGAGAGLALAAKAKAAVQCQAAIAKGSVGLVKLGFKTVQKCADAAALCIQLKPGDAACRAKAEAKCQPVFQGLEAQFAKLLATTAKKCLPPALAVGDLDDAAGLGFAAVTSPGGRCRQLTVTPADPTTTIIECVGVQGLCEGRQMLEHEVPRLAELARFLGVGIPP